MAAGPTTTSQSAVDAMIGELRRQRDMAFDRCVSMAATTAGLADELRDAKAQIGELLDREAQIRAEIVAAKTMHENSATAVKGDKGP